MNIRQKETFFCFIFSHPITTLSLFTYSVCDEKVKNKKNSNSSKIQRSRLILAQFTIKHHLVLVRLRTNFELYESKSA